MLATSSCLFADLGCELQLAVSNYSTCMLYLGEQELAAQARVLVKLVANIHYYISKNGEVDRRKST